MPSNCPQGHTLSVTTETLWDPQFFHRRKSSPGPRRWFLPSPPGGARALRPGGSRTRARVPASMRSLP